MASTKKVKAAKGEESLGTKLLQSVREMKARNFARSTEVTPNEVALTRQGTGLSQAEFAAALSISRRTLQEWEQRRGYPSGEAQTLIRITSKQPDVVREALACSWVCAEFLATE